MTAHVTVVVVSDHSADKDPLESPMSDRAMETVHSLEHQTFADKDLAIVRKVDDTPVLRLRQWAAEHLDTEWVSFIDEGDTWPPEMLESLVNGLNDGDTGCLVSIPPAKGQIVRRSFYLGLFSEDAS